VRDVIHTYEFGGSDIIIDLDFLYLSIPSNFAPLKYNKMKVYGNHFSIGND
jgi:hypothetical protein